jgi:hypothetical protein
MLDAGTEPSDLLLCTPSQETALLRDSLLGSFSMLSVTEKPKVLESSSCFEDSSSQRLYLRLLSR